MTRDEAAAIYKKHFPETCRPASAIDMMIELGILKVEYPKTATERALHAINYAIGQANHQFVSRAHLIEVLDKVGVRIVDK